MSMRIESKALVANLLILILLLGLAATAQYLTLRSQIESEVVRLQQSAALLLEPELKLTAAQRASAIRNLPGAVNVEIVDSKGATIGAAADASQPSATSRLWSALGLTAPAIVVEGSNLRATLALDLFSAHARAASQGAVLLIGWLVLVAISLFWLRSTVQRPLRQSLGEISRLLERLARREQGELKVSKGIAGEFRSLSDGLQKLQQDLVGRLGSTERELQDVRRIAYSDQLTGLPNRAQFMEELALLLADRSGREFGQLALLRTTVLAELNREQGYSHGDKFIEAVVAALRETLGRYPRAHAYRLNSSDFAIVMSQLASRDVEALIKTLLGRLEEVSLAFSVSRCAVVGAVTFGPERTISELLAQVDAATSRAANAGSGYLMAEHDGAVAILGEQQWRDQIDQLLAQRQLTLLKRSITALRENRNLHELMPRFNGRDGKPLATDALYGMAERLGRAESLDQLVVDQSLASLRAGRDPIQTLIPLSGFAVHSSPFLATLERQLLSEKQLASQLIFAVSEGALQRDLAAASRFIETIHRVGARVLVDDFGHGMTSFLFFRDLKPDFVRLATSFANDVEHDKNVQYYVKMLVDVCHRVGCRVIAAGISSQPQRYAIEGLAVDLVCGDHVAAPQPVAVA